MSDIFISYARADRARVKPLAEALGRQGWSVWWDYVIRPGQRFSQVIDEALEGAQCVIVVWSRHSVQSHWVEAEAEVGLRRGILVPARLDNVKIPLGFRGIQTADLVNWPATSPNAEFDGMVLAIAEVLAKAAPQELSQTPPSPTYAPTHERYQGPVSALHPGNFLVAVGGSGAKLVHSLIHLAAAGMLPANRNTLTALLVDPDENNGNVQECVALERAYQVCKQLRVGKTDLFGGDISLIGPWSPVPKAQADTLKGIFNYNQLANDDSEEAYLMDLFFTRSELEMSVKRGFRGRPAIGATVFANSVDFERGAWRDFRTAIEQSSAMKPTHILLAGSVFGGAGASVPILMRLLSKRLEKDMSNGRYGLVLFMPYFQFQLVEGGGVQVAPASFPRAAAEVLKYYDECAFLSACHTLYAIGEETPADMPVSGINDPHFLELIAGMGALRFFDTGSNAQDNRLAVACRSQEHTVTWDDLPCDSGLGGDSVRRQRNKLQKLAVFAVAYHYLFYPEITKAFTGGSKPPYWVEHIERAQVQPDDAFNALLATDNYTVKVLQWLMHISTPRRPNFVPGMVNPNVFGVFQGQTWRLKTPGEFNQTELSGLLLNCPKARIDDRTVLRRAAKSAVKDPGAAGPGRLVRALFDSCEVE